MREKAKAACNLLRPLSFPSPSFAGNCLLNNASSFLFLLLKQKLRRDLTGEPTPFVPTFITCRGAPSLIKSEISAFIDGKYQDKNSHPELPKCVVWMDKLSLKRKELLLYECCLWIKSERALLLIGI